MKPLIIAAVALALSTNAALGLSMFDDTAKLKGQYVLEVGVLEKLTCVASGNYDCFTWPSFFYRLTSSVCVNVQGLYSSYGGETGILTQDDYQSISLFVLGGLSISSKMTKYPATIYECP